MAAGTNTVTERYARKFREIQTTTVYMKYTHQSALYPEAAALSQTARRLLLGGLVAVTALSLSACAARKKIQVDGSSTVYPITEAVAEEFRGVNREVNVTVGVSGTGGGFKKFCNSEIDIADASRHIKQIEIDKCAEAGLEYLELPVAFDGLAVIVNKTNSFVDQLNVTQLKQIFRSESPAKLWSEVNPAWPAEEIKVYSPGKDSGTFDYFVEVILGKKAQMRPDAAYSEDDNILVTGVSGDTFSIGFFGLAYYQENADKLKIVPVINPETGAAVVPTLETVKTGTYAPLSRPVFIYVSKPALARPEVQQFVGFYMDEGDRLSEAVGYIPLTDEMYAENKQTIGL